MVKQESPKLLMGVRFSPLLPKVIYNWQVGLATKKSESFVRRMRWRARWERKTRQISRANEPMCWQTTKKLVKRYLMRHGCGSVLKYRRECAVVATSKWLHTTLGHAGGADTRLFRLNNINTIMVRRLVIAGRNGDIKPISNRSRLIICGKGRMTLGESPTRVRKFFFAEFFLRNTPAMDLVFFQANIMEIQFNGQNNGFLIHQSRFDSLYLYQYSGQSHAGQGLRSPAKQTRPFRGFRRKEPSRQADGKSAFPTQCLVRGHVQKV